MAELNKWKIDYSNKLLNVNLDLQIEYDLNDIGRSYKSPEYRICDVLVCMCYLQNIDL